MLRCDIFFSSKGEVVYNIFWEKFIIQKNFFEEKQKNIVLNYF
jgi:hypothetical protein